MGLILIIISHLQGVNFLFSLLQLGSGLCQGSYLFALNSTLNCYAQYFREGHPDGVLRRDVIWIYFLWQCSVVGFPRMLKSRKFNKNRSS